MFQVVEAVVVIVDIVDKSVHDVRVAPLDNRSVGVRGTSTVSTEGILVNQQGLRISYWLNV